MNLDEIYGKLFMNVYYDQCGEFMYIYMAYIQI